MEQDELQGDAPPLHDESLSDLFYSYLRQFDLGSEEALKILRDQLAVQFQAQTKQDRATMRNRLGQTLEGPPQRFSFDVISVRVHNGQLEIGWLRLEAQDDGPRRPRRLPLKGNKVHLNVLLSEAADGERDLIRTHELMARSLRELWSTYREALALFDRMRAGMKAFEALDIERARIMAISTQDKVKEAE